MVRTVIIKLNLSHPMGYVYDIISSFWDVYILK